MIDQMAHSYATQASNVVAYSKYVSASQYNTSNLPPITPVDKPNTPVSVTTPPPAAPTTSSASARAPHTSTGLSSKAGGVRASGPVRWARAAARRCHRSVMAVRHRLSFLPATDRQPRPVPHRPSSRRRRRHHPRARIAVPRLARANPSDRLDLSAAAGQVARTRGQAAQLSGSPGGPRPGTSLRGGLGAINEDAGGPRDRLGVVKPGTGGIASGANSGGGAAVDEEGPGGRSGAVPRSAGLAEEEGLAAERGASSTGITSSSAAPMGAGRGRQRRRRFRASAEMVVEEDGEELFGISGRLAPPVLGETPAEREQRHDKEADRHGDEP